MTAVYCTWTPVLVTPTCCVQLGNERVVGVQQVLRRRSETQDRLLRGGTSGREFRAEVGRVLRRKKTGVVRRLPGGRLPAVDRWPVVPGKK